MKCFILFEGNNFSVNCMVTSSTFVTTDGCPDSCYSHGRCQLQNGVWRCVCAKGWKGSSCSLAMEVECQSNRDEDEGEVQYFGMDSITYNMYSVLITCYFQKKSIKKQSSHYCELTGTHTSLDHLNDLGIMVNRW